MATRERGQYKKVVQLSALKGCHIPARGSALGKLCLERDIEP